MMAVYVDDMHQYPIGQFGRMKMSHMIADTTEELISMARRIGVQPKWIQKAGTHGEHFDIAMVKRDLAVKAGAIEVTLRQCSSMCARRRATGQLGEPGDAERWRNDYAMRGR